MKTEEVIFADALALPPAAREAFLARACGADALLRRRVEDLLTGYDHEGALLDRLPVPEITVARTGNHASNRQVAGTRIGRYRLLERLGEGGHGTVFVAEQEEPVRRRVALKVIKAGMDTREVIARFEAERQALALMDHPNIARVLDVGSTESGRPFFVMELVRGTPITRHCDEHQLDAAERLLLFTQVCSAVQHAHQKGIIHRDLKPSNILITLHDGVPVPKIIDFGIAKAMHARLTERTIYTRFEQFIGTPAYMSPEQLEMSGLDIDTRSDIYSLGVVLYELLTGNPPFGGEELARAGIEQLRRTIREKEPPRPSIRVSTLEAAAGARVARQRGTDPARLRSSLRGDVDWIVMRCLEKDRRRRYETANALAIDLLRCLRHEPVAARPPSTSYVLRKFIRRHRVAVAAAAAISSVIVIGCAITTVLTLRLLRAERVQHELRTAAQRAAESEAAARRTTEQEHQRMARIRWARETALPEIHRLVKIDDITAAFALAREAEEFIRDDPALVDLWPKITSDATITTTPAGADVYVKPYRKPSAGWEHIGTTPISSVRLARAPYRYQIRKAGFETLDKTDAGIIYEVSFTRKLAHILIASESNEATPPGMVRVPGKALDSLFTRLPAIEMDDYWIDVYEVTNQQFKVFVDAGAYVTGKFWEQPFLTNDGRVLPWQEAISKFRDATGMPGPSTWRNGTYPPGQADHPVIGVSWFEAAAYARFVGKRLPSIYHWRYAAPVKELEHVVQFSNFQSRRVAPVGSHQGMHAHGTFDMAGNAKEWCWNDEDRGRRYLLGGGWREQPYMFGNDDAQSPFDRSDQNGFRCVKLISDRPLDERIDAPRVVERYNVAAEKPVSDQEFEGFRILYSYDKTNLDPKFESRDDRHPHWVRENVTFNAAYNGERMAAMVFLPKSSKPPYQTIVFFPGSGARTLRSSETVAELPLLALWIEQGRAVIYPVLKGTYERNFSGSAPASDRIAGRDWTVQLHKDIARSIDYLETRHDIDTGKLAFIGWSWGGWMGPIVSALEPRLKVNVLMAGGFPALRMMPEANPLNFAPRVRAPTMLVNGRYDFVVPLESSQVPLFNALGTSPAHKKHVLFDTGHIIPFNQSNAEIFGWLDRYLGPVK